MGAMGSVKQTATKREGAKMLRVHKAELSTDFDKNQEIVAKLMDANKTIANRLAGYITRKMREPDTPRKKYVPKKPVRRGRRRGPPRRN